MTDQELFKSELDSLLLKYNATLAIEEISTGGWYSGDVRIIVEFNTSHFIEDIHLGNYYDGKVE